MREPRPTPTRRLVLAALLCLATLPALAQWKWRDKDGRITASDLPPPRDIPDRDILQRPDPTARHAAPAASSAASGALAGRAPVDKELEARRRAAAAPDAEAQAKARAEEERVAQQRAENCRRARSQAAALDSGQRIVRTNEKGEREVLDDKGRAEEMRRANEIIASDCR